VREEYSCEVVAEVDGAVDEVSDDEIDAIDLARVLDEGFSSLVLETEVGFV
jgi:hypothetical protein